MITVVKKLAALTTAWSASARTCAPEIRRSGLGNAQVVPMSSPCRPRLAALHAPQPALTAARMRRLGEVAAIVARPHGTGARGPALQRGAVRCAHRADPRRRLAPRHAARRGLEVEDHPIELADLLLHHVDI